MKSNYQLLIIGAGAAGIGAAHAARNAGLDVLLVEASHRVGGRGLTEELAPGIHWDLGCHWLHSADINPLTKVAEQLGMHFEKALPSRSFYLKGRRCSPAEEADYANYSDAIWQKMKQLEAEDGDVALSDLIDYDSPWASYYCYWQALMTSADVDQFSARDITAFEDTDENWPITDGYGTLLQRHAVDLPIELNTKVEKIDWSGDGVVVTTSRGVIRADQVVVTVSTGILGARDIQFVPELPVSMQEAVADLPLGCYNHFAMLYDEEWPFDADTPDRIDYSNGEDLNFGFKMKCSGWPYIYCAVAGRQAHWLERQPVAESEQLMMEALIDIFGTDFPRKITKFKASAWSTDPFIKGSYSASRPGRSHQRKTLATPLGERLYIAGEATSMRAFCTAHGAWETGRDAVGQCIADRAQQA